MTVENNVPNADRYTDFNTTTASSGPFALTFAIWAGSLAEAAGDIEVRIDGVPTAAFTVTGTPDLSSTPSVITNAAVVLDVAVANAHIEIEGNGAARRIYQYADGVGVAPRYQNSILNFCLATVRDIRQKIGRAIRAPYGEAPLELPAASARANKALGFDDSGNPIAIDDTDTGAFLAGTTNYTRSLLLTASASAFKALLALVKGDVGLGNVLNVAQVAKAGDTMEGELYLVNDTPIQDNEAAAKGYVDDGLALMLPKDGSEAMEAALPLTELSVTPAAPVAGQKKLYAKDDGDLYTLDSNGTERKVGSGSFRNTWDIVEEFGFDPSGADGTETANDAALALWAAHAVLHPKHTYRARRTDVFRMSASNVLIPANINLAFEGAQFLWEGDLSGGTTPIMTFDTGVEWDALRFEIVAGSDFRRALLFNGAHKGGLLELIAQSQVNNEGGVSASDYAIRLLNHDSKIDTIKAAYIDKVFQAAGPGDGNPGLDNAFGDFDIYSYVTGACFRNQRGVRMLSANIRERSANATSDPGHNGIVTEGVAEALFSNFVLRNAGEHGFRMGGTRNAEQTTEDVAITNGVIKSSGQSGLKLFTGIAGQRLRRVAMSNLTITDSGDDGDAPGFNDHGAMLQQAVDCSMSNVVIATDALANSSYDAVFISGATRLRMSGVQAMAAVRNGCRVSEFDDGSGSSPVETLPISGIKADGFRSENHGQEGLYIDCPSQAMRDIHFENLTLIGSNAAFSGVNFNGAAARAAQPCRFAGIVRNHTTKFTVPATANIKTLDYMA